MDLLLFKNIAFFCQNEGMEKIKLCFDVQENVMPLNLAGALISIVAQVSCWSVILTYVGVPIKEQSSNYGTHLPESPSLYVHFQKASFCISTDHNCITPQILITIFLLKYFYRCEYGSMMKQLSSWSNHWPHQCQSMLLLWKLHSLPHNNFLQSRATYIRREI